jgi:hypothetical protein
LNDFDDIGRVDYGHRRELLKRHALERSDLRGLHAHDREILDREAVQCTGRKDKVHVAAHADFFGAVEAGDRGLQRLNTDRPLHAHTQLDA